jgi:hypothetical protein
MLARSHVIPEIATMARHAFEQEIEAVTRLSPMTCVQTTLLEECLACSLYPVCPVWVCVCSV